MWIARAGEVAPPGCRTQPPSAADEKRLRAQEAASRAYARAHAECRLVAYEAVQRVVAKPQYNRGNVLDRFVFGPMLAKNEADAVEADTMRLCMEAKAPQ